MDSRGEPAERDRLLVRIRDDENLLRQANSQIIALNQELNRALGVVPTINVVSLMIEERLKNVVIRDRCTTCGMATNDDGTCDDCFLSNQNMLYVSPEEQRKNDAMERGDYERDRAKDEKAERKYHERLND
jgi:hypothetical protein